MRFNPDEEDEEENEGDPLDWIDELSVSQQVVQFCIILAGICESMEIARELANRILMVKYHLTPEELYQLYSSFHQLHTDLDNLLNEF